MGYVLTGKTAHAAMVLAEIVQIQKAVLISFARVATTRLPVEQAAVEGQAVPAEVLVPTAWPCRVSPVLSYD